MQKSSKKSWSRSRSTPDLAAPASAAGDGPPSRGGRGKEASQSPTSTPASEHGALLTVPLPFRYQLKLGKGYAIATFGGVALYFAAALIGNEWLYLLSAGLLIAPLIGAVYPLIVLSLVSVDVSAPKDVLIGEAATVSVKLKKKKAKNHFLSWLLPVRCLSLSVQVAKRGREGGADEVVMADSVLVRDLTDNSSFDFSTRSLQRGIYRLRQVDLECSFPFGLVGWVKSRLISGELGKLTVYPLIMPLAGNFLQHLEVCLAQPP